MRKATASYSDWVDPCAGIESAKTELPDERVHKIEVSYDNGRIFISINDVEVYANRFFGSDATVAIERD